MKINQIIQMMENETNPIIKQKLEISLTNARKFHEEELPLLNELKNIGIDVESVWDLVNNKSRLSEIYGDFTSDYEVAYPILIEHLSKKYHNRIREGIIRALTEKKAKSIAFAKLLEMFNEECDSNLKWVLANSLRTLMTWKERQKYPEIKRILDGR